MKKLILTTLSAICVAGLLNVARAQDNPPGGPDTNNPTPVDNNGPPPQPGDAPPGAPDMANGPGNDAGGATADQGGGTNKLAVGTNSSPAVLEDQPVGTAVPRKTTAADFMPPAALGTNIDELRLNFHDAPLDMVLNYLSDAAGFIIELDTDVHGTVSVISSHPMTRNEAVDLLNDVLNKNGYAAIRDGRRLTIVDKNDAKTRNIPVKVGNDPDAIENNAEIVTEIIPIRFVEADQLSKDLSLFVSPQATIVANEAGNSIIITDTQSNIKHLVEIIKAVDSSAEGETEIRVFHLDHANPQDVANELAVIFPSNNGTGGGSASPIRFGGGFPGGGGGPGGFFARMMGGGGGGGGGNAAAGGSSSRMQKQTQVLATPDARTSSVIVTASKDLMGEIDGMMHQLDVPSARDQKVYTFHMKNGDTLEDLQVLQSMFSGNNGSTGSRGGTTGGSSSSSSTSMMQQRATQNNSSEGTGSSSTSGGTTAGGGGGARGGGGGGF